MITKLRHLEMHELLALRDGEGTTFAREHVETCASCRGELERLYRIQAQLRALTTYTPPRDLWPDIAARIQRRRLRARFALGGAVGFAAAAVLAGVLMVRGPTAEQSQETAQGEWVAESASRDLGPFINRSRQLESMLQVYSPRYRVYNAPTALAVSALEDRIEILDRMLLESRETGVERGLLVSLWDERLAALETLVGLQLGAQGPVSESGPVWR